MRFTVVLVLFISLAFCGTATQTDWSGGPGVEGPVITLGNEFFLATGISCTTPSDLVLLQMALKHVVDSPGTNGGPMYSSDVDGDGDTDVLGTNSVGGIDVIKWWENSDTSPGIIWTEHTVAEIGSDASSVYSADVNGDGYMDVLGTSWTGNSIKWWENSDGSGTSWMEHTVVIYVFYGASSVHSADVDGDGDADILGAASSGDQITWWENTNGSGTNWTERPIDYDFNGAQSVYSADVNGDGYMDVLGAASTAGDITWWENVDGSGTNWNEHTVDGDFGEACSVHSADINGDGYIDVLGAASAANDITWWENIDGSGTNWTEHTVDGDFDGACSVRSADINGDGYMDILGAAQDAGDITWWENVDGSGTSWTEHTVDDDFISATSVCSADINGDSYMDVLGSVCYPFEIAWWDYFPDAWLESSILYVQSDPDWQWIDWTCSTPPGTSVSFQVRASDDYTNMGAWSDTLSYPSDLEGILIDDDSYFQYRAIMQTTDPGITPVLNDVTISWDPVSIGETTEPIPPDITLLPIAPNPSVGSPVIRFGLPEPSSVSIFFFDLSGRLVSETNGSDFSSGYHDVQLLSGMSPGVYFCRMISGDFAAEQRFVVIK